MSVFGKAPQGDGPLNGLRVVEISAFVAAPLGGMTLAQLGADVIRIDPIGGNIDAGRWPLAPSGASLYWAGLNKGKKSVHLALDTVEGQALAAGIITAPGPDAGIVITNLPAKGWLAYEKLCRARPDLIMVQLVGNADGSSAVDYTVNCASGFPIATGATLDPVNHVLPAWDVAAGLHVAIGLLAAERRRTRTGEGQYVRLALSDVMLATVASLGYVGDVQLNGESRGPIGNDLYGAFGRDFMTADGRHVMIAAISDRQWHAIGRATGLGPELEELGSMAVIDLGSEGGRFLARHKIAEVLQPWFANRTLRDVEDAFDGSGVLWGPYRDFRQLVEEDVRCSTANPLFGEIDQIGIGHMLANRNALSFSRTGTPAAMGAPAMGADTRAVLSTLLALSSSQIDALQRNGVAGL